MIQNATLKRLDPKLLLEQHQNHTCATRFFSSVKVVVSVTSARTWSKMGSSTLSKTRVQKGVVKAAPWNLSVSKSTSNALYLWRKNREGGSQLLF